MSSIKCMYSIKYHKYSYCNKYVQTRGVVYKVERHVRWYKVEDSSFICATMDTTGVPLDE